MSRSFTYNALTLRVKAQGESNREAWFLTAEEGIIRAVVYGGPKSRLRALVAPYHEGKLWIYYDPVRDSRKVSDFDVHSYRVGLRELWERAMTAGAIAETILFSQGGGGGWNEALKLAQEVIDTLDNADAAACSRLGIYFLWRWACFLGSRPNLSLLENEEVYRGPGSPSPVRIGKGALAWLKKIESLLARDIVRVSLDNDSLEQARALSKTVLAESLGKRLPTWEHI